MRFWLGTHMPSWCARPEFRGVPLMISRRTLAKYRTMPRSITPIFRDSGGFTELNLHGGWHDVPIQQFVDEARLHCAEVGNIQYLAPQDWMCEPIVLKRTGRMVMQHQQLTVDNYLDLMYRAPDLPWVPVLQGWSIDDYLRCVEMYDRAGVNLRSQSLVGLGTVCRRQGTREGGRIVNTLASLGIRLHGFGFKVSGLRECASQLASADSLAWSFGARYEAPLPGCTHKNCANCKRYALRWYDGILATIEDNRGKPVQLALAA